ncbi:suppressor of fused domain protein [Psychrobium sp. MM17-31]|uniref:suppressor of fused domain protein n=1 Tax=Psychrobium sp. MM17-31 TaxID=2917758 RepID=UPI001EF6F716|nr:suppressor of fused domain protein [Psychrobium sp. MM17-31]MCG7529977.1 suppressor of fused domain protein [Psychrobium sp. MM17-31]
MSLLEDAWEQREVQIYPALFGGTGEGIYPLDNTIFSNQFNVEEIDPRWLHFGVFKCPPIATRDTWVYVTSGMSNPWEHVEPDEFSGFGMEFILETDIEYDWAIPIMRSLLAFNILVSVGHYGDKPLIDYGDRIPQSVAQNIASLLVVEPKLFPSSFQLTSGRVDLLQITGITVQELEFAKVQGSDELANKLFDCYGSFKIEPKRLSIV